MVIIGLFVGGGWVVFGSICFDGKEIVYVLEYELCMICGCDIGFVLQDLMLNLNLVVKIGIQVVEILFVYGFVIRQNVQVKVVEVFSVVGFFDLE